MDNVTNLDHLGSANPTATQVIETRSAPSTQGGSRRRWFLPLLMCITLAACLIAAEGAIRLFWSPDHPKQPARWAFDAEMGLAHTPGRYEIPFRRCLYGKECEDVLVKFTINHQGFRAVRDYSDPGGHPLIAVLGDSMIEAAQVDDDRTMCNVLEGALRSRFAGVEVRNAGMNSAGFVHYYTRWRKLVAPMHPDVLIVAALGINDFRNCSTTLETFVAMRPHYTVADGESREVRFEPLPEAHSKARRFVASLYGPLELTRFLGWMSAVKQENAKASAISGGSSGIAPDAHIYEEPPRAEYAEAVGIGREYLERLIREASAAGTKVIVVYLPWAGEAVDAQWDSMRAEYESGAHDGNLVRTRPEQIVRESATAAGAAFFSFSDTVRGLSPGERRSLWHDRIDSHLTEKVIDCLRKAWPQSWKKRSPRTAGCCDNREEIHSVEEEPDNIVRANRC